MALSFSDVLEDFGGVAFGFDGGPDGFDFTGFADEERTADDAQEFASHELFLLPRAVGGDGFVVGIAEQREIEFEFGFEQGLRFDGVGARAEDGYFESVELPFCVAKLGRLDDSTGGVGFGEEKKEDALALEVFKRNGFVFVGLEAERGGFVAGLEHGVLWACVVVSVLRRLTFSIRANSPLSTTGSNGKSFRISVDGKSGGKPPHSQRVPATDWSYCNAHKKRAQQ